MTKKDLKLDDKRPSIYNPVNPAKQRKPKKGHPWAVYAPGLFSSRGRS